MEPSFSAPREPLQRDGIAPIVQGFSLKTTFPAGLWGQIEWWYCYKGIRDPQETIARMRVPASGAVDYSDYLASLFAFASTWAYADPATFAFMMADYGMKDWDFYYARLSNDPLFVVNTVYLMQSPNKEVAILCFRGTEPRNALNWLTDLSVSPERFLEGRVHGGILRNMMAVWPLVLMGLRRAQLGESVSAMSTLPAEELAGCDVPSERESKLKALYITGHSLGGAMAGLTAAYLWKNPLYSEFRDRLRGCYTYGAPMIAAPDLAAVLDKEMGNLVFRHVYGSDVVPQLPPLTTGEFRHFGRTYISRHLSEGWTYTPQAIAQLRLVSLLPLAAVAMVAEQFPAARPWLKFLPLSIDHHSPRYYMRISELSRGPAY